MATLTMPDVVNQIIEGNGRYEGDPQVVKIVEYNNQFDGKKAWGVVYESESHHPSSYNRYEESGACINPRVVWQVGMPTDVRVSR